MIELKSYIARQGQIYLPAGALSVLIAQERYVVSIYID